MTAVLSLERSASHDDVATSASKSCHASLRMSLTAASRGCDRSSNRRALRCVREDCRMSPETAQRLRFRGALVAGRWTRSQPSDIVELDGDTLLFSPWLRPNYELRRDDVAEVRIEKVRLPPFWWGTEFGSSSSAVVKLRSCSDHGDRACSARRFGNAAGRSFPRHGTRKCRSALLTR